MPKPASTVSTATILAGQSLSSSLDLTAGSLGLLMSPDAWTPANISFALSQDNITFRDLYDSNGVELLHPMGAARAYIIDPLMSSAAFYLKIRSGPSENPVAQDADRAFVCVVMA